jgi:hypothetical protein
MRLAIIGDFNAGFLKTVSVVQTAYSPLGSDDSTSLI